MSAGEDNVGVRVDKLRRHAGREKETQRSEFKK